MPISRISGKKTFYFTERKKNLLFTLLLPLLPLRLNKISELDEIKNNCIHFFFPDEINIRMRI